MIRPVNYVFDERTQSILFRTDFSKHWGTPAYFTDNPFLTADAAELLVSKHPAFVGIDSLNIDDTGDPAETLDLYEDGDHLSHEGRRRYTERFAERVRLQLP